VTAQGVRPVVAGYLAVPAQASLNAVEGLVGAWRESLAAYARREGYALGAVFVDVRGRGERGLYGLAEYLRRDGVVGVIVPDVGHLTHVRCLAGRTGGQHSGSCRRRCCRWRPARRGWLMAAGEGPAVPEERQFGDMFARPNIARIYDYLLGGKDNFEVDREVAAHLAEVQPLVVAGVRANRAFVRRATAFLAERGIAQFIDLGSGLPIGDNVHEVAQRVNPDTKVVYVDNDPIVLVHGQALLADNHRTIVIEGDIRKPEQILADRQVRGLIDIEQQVAVLCAAIMHFVSDTEDPARIVRTFREVMAPGSALVISHVVDDGDEQRDAATREGAAIYCETTAPFVLRSRAQVSAWFEGFTLVPPGLVEADAWRRKGNGKARAPIVAGVGFLDPPGGRG
jgi:hypothetical protein